MDKEKVEDENDNVECTVPAGVLYSMCCHCVPDKEEDSVRNNSSRPSSSQEGSAQTQISMIRKGTILFIMVVYGLADPSKNNT